MPACKGAAICVGDIQTGSSCRARLLIKFANALDLLTCCPGAVGVFQTHGFKPMGPSPVVHDALAGGHVCCIDLSTNRWRTV